MQGLRKTSNKNVWDCIYGIDTLSQGMKWDREVI